jgi:hypothetical protein
MCRTYPNDGELVARAQPWWIKRAPFLRVPLAAGSPVRRRGPARNFLLTKSQYLKSLNEFIHVLLLNESFVLVIRYDKNTRQTRPTDYDITTDEYRTVGVVSHVSPS